MNLTLIKTAAAGRYRAWLSPWTGLYLLFSVLINLAFGYPLSLPYSVAFTVLLLLLAAVAPRSLKVLVAGTALVAGLYYPFGQAFGPPNFNTLLAMHATSVEEASETLLIFPLHDYLLGLLIVVCGAIALWRKAPVRRRWGHLHSAGLALVAIAWLTQPVLNQLTGGVFNPKDAGIPLVRFVKDTLESKLSVNREISRMQQLSTLQDDWHLLGVKPDRQIYVVVIGESARRDALGAFGGHWDNTPFASQLPGQFFTRYTSAASSTQKSLGLTLNLVSNGTPQYQNNIISLANRAGFDTWWISNQGQIGQYDTPVASIALRAKNVHFLKQGDFEADKNTRDEDLLPFTAAALARPVDAPRLLVYHLVGSHPKACDRTRGRYVEFLHSKETSCYLYSITQTDGFLQQLWQQLHNSGLSYSMIYFSDHGLAFKEKGTVNEYLTHDDKYRQNFEVPLFVASSGDTHHQVIDRPRSANDFLTLFSQWTGIRTREITPGYRFISAEKAPPVEVTNFALKRLPFSQLQQDPILK
ncbi:sulfatase-like hydrolase/transferase [Erwinia sp. E602]|uniref:phosphoethanolamine transferase n=1 Tax=Erwinia sp. E602 TaxID=2675378 RepID=UPI001BA5B295|nr:sulfatase-like hydrolase/transferase [Erwinia sp. E602]QUG76527.1 sulfatase-like hydrolase/transferase [Erwinia sp. E602]